MVMAWVLSRPGTEDLLEYWEHKRTRHGVELSIQIEIDRCIESGGEQRRLQEGYIRNIISVLI